MCPPRRWSDVEPADDRGCEVPIFRPYLGRSRSHPPGLVALDVRGGVVSQRWPGLAENVSAPLRLPPRHLIHPRLQAPCAGLRRRHPPLPRERGSNLHAVVRVHAKAPTASSNPSLWIVPISHRPLLFVLHDAAPGTLVPSPTGCTRVPEAEREIAEHLPIAQKVEGHAAGITGLSCSSRRGVA